MRQKHLVPTKDPFQDTVAAARPGTTLPSPHHMSTDALRLHARKKRKEKKEKQQLSFC